MPCLVNSLLNLMIKLSYLQSAISLICNLVGSHFIPAPPEQINLIPLSLLILINSTFASKLSIQSTTQSNSGFNISPAFSTVMYFYTVYIVMWGRIEFMNFFRHYTFAVPTSLRTAQECLFRLLRDTLSKSTIFIFFIPERANMLTTCEPTPPTPSTITYEFSIFLNLSSPKYLITLASCSLLMKSYCSDSTSTFFSSFSPLPPAPLPLHNTQKAVARAAPPAKQARCDLSMFLLQNQQQAKWYYYQSVDINMEEEIAINVVNPEQRQELGGVNKYFIYWLKGQDARGDINCSRRYSDFNLLRQILLKRWPGCYIPSLPEKKTIGANQLLFIQSRRRGLQMFLQSISHTDAIWNSEEVQIFLKTSSTDVEKQLSPLIKQSTQKLFKRYKDIFQKFNNEHIEEGQEKINQFSSYIKDSKIFLEKLSENAQKMIQTYKLNLEKNLSFMEFLLPDYEKSCLLENDQKKKNDALLFTVDDFQIKEAIGDYKKAGEYPPSMFVIEEIKRERKELECLEDIIKNRNQFQSLKLKARSKVKDCQIKESKINAGKQSIFSKITKQTKEEQLAQNQKDLQSAQQQQHMLATLSDIVTNLLGKRQIDRFKQLRQKSYYKMLRDFAQCQKTLAMSEHQIWARASEHQKIWEESFEQSGGLKGKNSKQSKDLKEEVEEERKQIVEVMKKKAEQIKNKTEEEKISKIVQQSSKQELQTNKQNPL